MLQSTVLIADKDVGSSHECGVVCEECSQCSDIIIIIIIIIKIIIIIIIILKAKTHTSCYRRPGIGGLCQETSRAASVKSRSCSKLWPPLKA
jgi:hypothetical protein